MENREWIIELTEDQLSLISRSLEFVSRFACGQIGHTYLPHEIQELFYIKDDSGNINWDDTNRRRDSYDMLGNLIKSMIYPELSPSTNISYGINKNDFADNLYDIYKMINHKKHIQNSINTAPEDERFNVNSSFLKCGNHPNIKLKVKE